MSEMTVGQPAEVIGAEVVFGWEVEALLDIC